MSRIRKIQKRLIKDMALKRIEVLFELAKKEHKLHSDWSNRYIILIRKISMRYRVRLKKEQKMRMCKNCNTFLMPGSSSRIRLHKKKYLLITCLNCEKIKRYPYIQNKRNLHNE
ncbi:MAG: ribonuclease P [Methanosarcinaceae archaeon]|nr:ribonuclease P [Methanosarcinaceae archaeon]